MQKLCSSRKENCGESIKVKGLKARMSAEQAGCLPGQENRNDFNAAKVVQKKDIISAVSRKNSDSFKNKEQPLQKVEG